MWAPGVDGAVVVSQRGGDYELVTTISWPEGLFTDEDVTTIGAYFRETLTAIAALGTGGLPRGRIIEIYGPESSGKTTLALHMIAEAQKKGGTCAFVDAEHALDPGYAKKLGVDTDVLAAVLVLRGRLDARISQSVAAGWFSLLIAGTMT